MLLYTILSLLGAGIGVQGYYADPLLSDQQQAAYGLSDLFLREVGKHMNNDYDSQPYDENLSLDELAQNLAALESAQQQQQGPGVDLRNWDGPSTSIRDQEYLQHSSLFGHQFVAGGAGEGEQRLSPSGKLSNFQEVKTDAVLPAYCNPPNPCPVGYTAADGCIEDFENSAAFSREYQSSQHCMCDSEHMFSCSDSSKPDGNDDDDDEESNGGDDEGDINTLARSIQNEGLTNNNIDQILKQMKGENKRHFTVAKKFSMDQRENPFLQGDKLPIAAKKGNIPPHH